MMKLALLTGSVAILAGGTLFSPARVKQNGLPSLLVSHLEKLKTAQSAEIDFVVRKVGGTTTEYKLSLSKPGSFKLTRPGGTVVCDGKTLTEFDSAKNTYVQSPVNEGTLSLVLGSAEAQVWSPLLMTGYEKSILASKVGVARKIQGFDVTEVDVVPMKGDPITLYIDAKLGAARGFRRKSLADETIVFSKSLTLSAQPAESALFAFVPPAGATKIEPSQVPTFAQVNEIMQASCMPCHNARNQRGGVTLTGYAGVAATVTPGDPDGSSLVKSIKGDGRTRMPKNKPALEANKIKLIETWIKEGAKEN